MKVKILFVLALLVALVVAGCGGGDAKSGMDMGSMGSNSSTSAGNGADRAFVAEMIPHHKSAVDMAKIAQQRGQSTFVKTLADNIVRTQSEEIATMRAEDKKLAAAGVKKGSLGMDMGSMNMSMDTGMLKSADPFDPEFLKMMIPHHKSAVMMAQMELDKGKSAKLKALAKDIISAQNKEIDEMNQQLGRS